jgi:site-specific DNA-methyltransferase (adenine-specific)
MQDNKNTLYYGDNLFILREHIQSESVDLIYLDPPFNSNRTYNVLFKDEHGTDSEAQLEAFEDTWHWNLEAEHTYAELLTEAPTHVAVMIESIRDLIGTNQMMAYLVMMTVRLVELHRVLKLTGSLYLHCDPIASHYLKIILDTIFGISQFRNEIIWKRTSAHSDTKQGNVIHMGRVHDVILFYTKTELAKRNEVYRPYEKEYIERYYKFLEPNTGRKYWLDNIQGPGGAAKGNPQYEVMGITRYWRYSRERMQKLVEEGRIIQTNPGTVPKYKRYLDEMHGRPLQDVWDDVKSLGGLGGSISERLGYPTQKPLNLLERIVLTSSNPGDVVLDPFCGCGTAVAAAEKLKRKWLGIDITHLSITTMKNRLKQTYPGIQFKTIGEPKDVGSAQQLAYDDRYQFQWWALSLVDAMPLGGQEGSREGKKGSDKGIDGIITFVDDESGKAKKALVQVKSGHVNSSMIRDLLGTIQREKAAIGIFVTLDNPTKDMVTEALTAGFYNSSGWKRNIP